MTKIGKDSILEKLHTTLRDWRAGYGELGDARQVWKTQTAK